MRLQADEVILGQCRCGVAGSSANPIVVPDDMEVFGSGFPGGVLEEALRSPAQTLVERSQEGIVVTDEEEVAELEHQAAGSRRHEEEEEAIRYFALHPLGTPSPPSSPGSPLGPSDEEYILAGRQLPS
jgi:hypothetical protein